MTLTKFVPAPALQPFIKCYYITESDYKQYVVDSFFADGCVEMVFHLGVDFYRGEEKENWASIIGQITQPLQVSAIGRGKSFGIWFLPHAFSLFCDIPVKELNDKATAVDTVFKTDICEQVGNHLYNEDIDGLLMYINRTLIKMIEGRRPSVQDELSALAVQYFSQHKDDLSIDKLVVDCNISNRYLQKVFLHKLGVSPKFYMRVTRFQQAMHLVNKGQKTALASIAYETNYFDQAHFVREFKAFTGFTPSLYRNTWQPINSHFRDF